MDYIKGLYDDYVTKYADPRVENLPLMNSPRIAIYSVILYLIFVKIVGPLYMKNRAPYDLKKYIVIYNGFQTIFSFTLVVLGIYFAWKINFSFICQVTDPTKTDHDTMQAIKICWVYTLGRFIEFIDTIFFVLRKKNNHISLLHVVHHAAVPLICWYGMKVEPAGHYVLAGGINTFVHTFMYFYYMVAAMGPEYKKYLWWKKYVTILQLVQFLVVFSHAVWTILSACPVNKIFGYMILFQSMFFFNLFLDFYKESFGYTSADLSALFNLDKYYIKYKKFFEMCIPDQSALMKDDEGNDDDNVNEKEHDE